MIWRILPHATLCSASERLILLDVRRDRYFGVPSALQRDARAWLEGDTSLAPAPIECMLRDADILRPGDPAPSNASRETIRLPGELVSPTWRTAEVPSRRRSVIAAQIATRTKLRWRPLHDVLHDHLHVATVRPPVDRAQLEARCAIFARSRAFSPFPRNCLLDTLSLDLWLGDDARDCRVVLGVTANPFTAHCWLQSPHAVLSDSYDQVSRHTPILAV